MPIGLGATILRDVPAFAVYFGAFFWLKQMFNNHNNLQRRKVTNIYAIMMAGGLAGKQYTYMHMNIYIYVNTCKYKYMNLVFV